MEFSPPSTARDANSALQTFFSRCDHTRWSRINATLPEYGCNDRLCNARRYRLVFDFRQHQTEIPTHRELTQSQSGAFICVNTLWANRLTKEAILNESISELSGYSSLKSEVKYGAERSRIDFMLQADSRPDCYIEVKSVTLAENEQGYFPDAVTERGQKHLRELMSVAAEGQRAVIFFAVLHSAITRFSPARHIDEKYAQLLSEAQQRG